MRVVQHQVVSHHRVPVSHDGDAGAQERPLVPTIRSEFVLPVAVHVVAGNDDSGRRRE